MEDVAWDALAFVPLPGKPQDFVVAMGDSYISGEGAGNYYGETDTNYGDHGWNACRRSKNAWPRKLVLPGTGSSLGQRADSHSAALDFQFVACSGATASDMSDTTAPGYWQNPPSSYSSFTGQAEGQFGEISQLKSGVLSSDTTLVLLSAGGNDAGFPTVLEDCATGNCASSGQEHAIQDDIDDAVGEVADLVDAIRVEAPNATIVLAGYPMLFSERIYNDPLHPGFCVAPGMYTMNEAMMLNSLAHYFRDVHKGMIMSRGDGYQLVDLVSRFGDRGACHNSEEIHAVVEGPTGDGDFRFIGGTPQCFGWTLLNFCVSRSSFHPKDSGTTRYGSAVADRLACAEFCVGSTGPGGDRARPVTFS